MWILPVLTNIEPVHCDFFQHAWICCRAMRDSDPNFPSLSFVASGWAILNTLEKTIYSFPNSLWNKSPRVIPIQSGRAFITTHVAFAAVKSLSTCIWRTILSGSAYALVSRCDDASRRRRRRFGRALIARVSIFTGAVDRVRYLLLSEILSVKVVLWWHTKQRTPLIVEQLPFFQNKEAETPPKTAGKCRYFLCSEDLARHYSCKHQDA